MQAIFSTVYAGAPDKRLVEVASGLLDICYSAPAMPATVGVVALCHATTPAMYCMQLHFTSMSCRHFCLMLSCATVSAGVPVERAVELASALLDHLLSCAPAMPDAPPQQATAKATKAAANGAQRSKKTKGKKRKDAAAKDVPQEVVRSFTMSFCCGFKPVQAAWCPLKAAKMHGSPPSLCMSAAKLLMH